MMLTPEEQGQYREFEPDRFCLRRVTWRHRFRIHRLYGRGRIVAFILAIFKVL